MTVTLKFHELKELATFKSFVFTNKLELNAKRVTITCDCSATKISHAVTYCDRKIVSLISSRNANSN